MKILFVLSAIELAVFTCQGFETSLVGVKPAKRQFSHFAKRTNIRRKDETVVVDVSSSGPSPRILWCEDVSKTFDGKRFQFRGVSFSVGQGSRLGLIGVNGAGKSTLLKCLTGVGSVDTGRIGVEGRPRVIHVEQEPARPFNGDESARTVADVLTTPLGGLGSTFATNDENRMEKALSALRAYWLVVDNMDSDAAMFETATAAMDSDGGWDLEQELKVVATKLNIADEMLKRSVASLSGGERKRVALCAALVQVGGMFCV
jgi:ABC transport system ATP-binding/permease protein